MKSVLITGGSGKVGLQLVKHFLKNNFLVVTTTRNLRKFKKNNFSKLSNNHISNLHLIEVDFVKKDAINKIKSYISQRNIAIDNIIHNARNLDFLKIRDDNSVSKENFEGEFFLAVIFPYNLSLNLIKQQNKPLKNIVFISSIYGIVAPTPSLYKDFHKSSPINYGVSKAAQIHLTKELSVRLAPKTRVNCVSFGGIKGSTSDEFIKRYSKLNPQNKMLDEIDVIAPIDFLISKGSENMTGQNLIIDNGWSVW